MDLNELRTVVERLALASTGNWACSRSKRKQEERAFHNASKATRDRTDLGGDAYKAMHGNKKFYSVVDASHFYLNAWLARHAPGAVFLDYGCGTGEQAIIAAKLGCALAIGIDISDGSIDRARDNARTAGVADRCVFVQADCERTGLPDESIDVVLCSGMLHHVDLSYAFPELRRIMKPGARALAFEALAYNPAFWLYRRLTPLMRTAWEKEHTLSMRDVRFASRFFNIGEVRFWHLFILLAVMVRSVPPLFAGARWLLDGVDAIALRIPGLRLLAWQFTFEFGRSAER